MAPIFNFYGRTFRSTLNILQKNVLNLSSSEIFYRYLRGSRQGKNLNSEEFRYKRLLKALQNNTKQSDDNLISKNAVGEDISKVMPKNALSREASNKPKENSTVITLENQFLMLEEKITPIKDFPYTRQLEIKYKKSLNFLRLFGAKLESLKLQIAFGRDKLPCPVEITVPSPLTEAYRNKDEFSIGRGIDGSEKTVGFYMDNGLDNSVPLCINPDELIIIKESHKKFVKHFQNFIRQSSLPACVKPDNKGYWKNVFVRSNCQGDLMGIIVMHPQALNKEELEIEKDKLRKYFSSVYETSHELKSLYFQACPHSRCTHEQSPFELLLGEPTIIETANGMKFHISPDSFFHVNTKAAESMFNSILKLCRGKKSATILDIFCGTGSLSLTFSSHVKHCIGIDNSTQAISDAKRNAGINKTHNVEFICGQPESVLKDIFCDSYYGDLIAVLNQSTSIFSKHTITSLRECKHLRKIIYVTSKPKAEFENFVNLCKPQGLHHYLGEAFLPILAVPVDLYPQTEHYGLVVMFQRL